MTSFSSGVDRRTILAGLISLGATGHARAEDSDSPLAHGALANNPVAQAFEAYTRGLPDVTLVGAKGEREIGDLKGRTILMPLWAEWCAPCLSEFPDFARLQQKYGNDKFAIVPVLSGTQKQLTPAILTEMFSLMHASVFEPLAEERYGKRLVLAMARRGRGYSLPCNLIIAPNGRVVAREMGMRPKTPITSDTPRTMTQDDKDRIMSQIQAGDSLTQWGDAPGEEFIAALAGGFLG